jgi:hypothetical protein
MEASRFHDLVKRVNGNSIAQPSQIPVDVVLEAAACTGCLRPADIGEVDGRGIDDDRSGPFEFLDRGRKDLNDLRIGGVAFVGLSK